MLRSNWPDETAHERHLRVKLLRTRSIWTDLLFLVYLVLTTPLLIARGITASGGTRLLLVGGHLTVAALIGVAVRRSAGSSHSRFIRHVRDLYPLALLLPLYGELGFVSTGLYGEAARWDPLVAEWDRLVFGGHPHRYLRTVLDARFWSELFHFAYVSYYGLLVGAYLWMWRRSRADFDRFRFVFSASFLSFLGLFVLFPVEGPMDEFAGGGAGGPFERLVGMIYGLAGETTMIGAFPSSHVGQATAAVLALGPERKGDGRSLVLAGWIGLIAVSTVYGGFHYAIDAVAGLLAGLALWGFWTGLYDRLERSVIVRPHPRSRAG